MKRWMLQCTESSGELVAVAVEAADAASAEAVGREGGLKVVRVIAVKELPAAAAGGLPDRVAAKATGQQSRNQFGPLSYAEYDPEHAEWMRRATHFAERAERRAHRSARSERFGGTLVMLGILGLVSALLAAGVGAAVAIDAGRGSGAGWFGFVILLASISAFLLLFGAIYHTVGRLGLDLAEQADRVRDEERSE